MKWKNFLFEGATAKAQQRGALAASQVLKALIDGLEIAPTTVVYAIDLFGNRQGLIVSCATVTMFCFSNIMAGGLWSGLGAHGLDSPSRYWIGISAFTDLL